MTDSLRPVGETHVCASCKRPIENERRFEGHDELTCMQPEIRFRRIERECASTHAALHELTEFVRRIYGAGADLNKNLDVVIEKLAAVEALAVALHDVGGTGLRARDELGPPITINRTPEPEPEGDPPS